MYLREYDEIFLITDRLPDWITNVGLIPFYEYNKKTSTNILNKISESFNLAGETVLQWQDDIFLTRPLSVMDIKYWYEGTLETAIERTHGGYKTLVESTAKVITENALFMDIHTPIIYEKKYFDFLKGYKWFKRQYLVKSLYYHHSGGEIEEMKDCKIAGPHEDKMSLIGDSLFFSTSPQAIDEQMIGIFQQLYPHPSRYEKA